MLRIPNLLRSKLPKKVPMRAGLPNWHRPDPPPSAEVPFDHQLTDQQLVFHFFDRNMSEFFLSQPEVYEGDTLMEASPMLIKGLGLWLGLGLIVGGTLYLTSPLRSSYVVTPSIEQKYESEKKIVQSKQWLNWARKNEIGIKLSSQSYPQYREGLTDISSNYKQIKKDIDLNTAINNEAKQYFIKLRQKCEHIVEERLANPDAHSHHH